MLSLIILIILNTHRQDVPETSFGNARVVSCYNIFEPSKFTIRYSCDQSTIIKFSIDNKLLIEIGVINHTVKSIKYSTSL